MTGTIRMERVYPHPPALVWRCLTEADLLEQWLMANDMRPEVGHRFTFTTDPGPGFDGIVRCEVLALEPERHMVWSWQGGPLDTQVRFELTRHPLPDGGEGCRLRLTHSGFQGLKSRLVQAILRIGNRTLYGKKLPALLRRLAGGSGGDGAPDPAACMSPWQRVLILISGCVPSRKGSAGRNPPTES